jgi:hypothetical protein
MSAADKAKLEETGVYNKATRRVSDFNAVTENGMYYGWQAANAPRLDNSSFNLLHLGQDTPHAGQIAISYYGTENKMFLRSRDGQGGYGPWVQVWTQQDLPLESGTWTPELYGSGEAGSPVYTSRRAGIYTRAGRQVTAAFTLELSGKGGLESPFLFVRGFPFAAVSGAASPPVFITETRGTIPGILMIAGSLWGGRAIMGLTKITAAGQSYLGADDITDNFSLYAGTVTYVI